MSARATVARAPWLCAALAAAAAAQPRTTTLQLGKGETLLAVLIADIDGDGRSDLALARRSEPDRRRLTVHLQRATGDAFTAEPDSSRDLPAEVVACAFLDCDARTPGAELLLFAPRVVAALAMPDGAPRALGTCELLFQPASPGRLIAAQSWVHDLDGDGRLDVLLPEPDGYRVGLQRGTGADVKLAMFPLRLPPTPEPSLPALRHRPERRAGLTLRLDDGDTPVALLEERATCPLPRVLDFDGDGRVDVVALDRPRLSVFSAVDGGFGAAPTQVVDVAEAAVIRLLEPGFFADLVDFDGDARPELVLARTDAAEGQGFTTTVAILPPPYAQVRARVRVQGLIAAPQFDDVDGDGHPDLTIGSLRTDSLAKLEGAGADVEAQVTVFLTRDGKPKLPAALTWRTQVSPDSVRGQRRGGARFPGDLDGDGGADLLVQDAERSLQALTATRRGDALQLTPLWQTKLPAGARAAQRMPHAPCDDTVIAGDGEVLHVRWR